MQMILNFDQNTAYSANTEQVLSFLAEKLPAEVKRLFARCSEAVITGNAEIKNSISHDLFMPLENTESPILHEKGIFMGMQAGLTAKKEALVRMTEEGYTKYSSKNSMYYFEELEVSLHFDEKDILDEITLEKSCFILTSKGLQVGDTIEKAVEIYGQPRFQAIASAMWANNLTVSIKDGHITSIRVQGIR